MATALSFDPDVYCLLPLQSPPGIPLVAAAAAADCINIPSLAGAILLVSNRNPEIHTPKPLYSLWYLWLCEVGEDLAQQGGGCAGVEGRQQPGSASCEPPKHSAWEASVYYKVMLLPGEGQENQGFTKSSDSLPLHCLKKLGFKYFKNFPLLSATLHLSNITSSESEEFLKNLFSSNRD